jgi:hypothetical protein
MKIFLILSKRLLVALFLIVVLSVLFIGRFLGSSIVDKNADTHKKRIDFINNLGYKIDEMPVKIINHRESTIHIFRDSIKMMRDVRKIRKDVKKKSKKEKERA